MIKGFYKGLVKEVEQVRHYQNCNGLQAEISKEEYWDQLEALPPLVQGNNYFISGEPLTTDENGTEYFCFYKNKGKYYSIVMTKNGFISFLKKNFKAFEGIQP
jgi:hypothetical protein